MGFKKKEIFIKEIKENLLNARELTVDVISTLKTTVTIVFSVVCVF